MKKILFLVNGLGLGNSIRIYSLIERLNKDNVDLCFLSLDDDGIAALRSAIYYVNVSY